MSLQCPCPSPRPCLLLTVIWIFVTVFHMLSLPTSLAYTCTSFLFTRTPTHTRLGPFTSLLSKRNRGCSQFISRTLALPLRAASSSLSSSSETLNSTAESEACAPIPVITGFHKLGLMPEVADALVTLGYTEPMPVQKIAIPRLLMGENLVLAAATGSGKTLAYLVPPIQGLKVQELSGYRREAQRPRCLVLVPTRELARQVLTSVKDLSHHVKLSSCAVLGGEQYGMQKKKLEGVVDLVVASPGRLKQHWDQGNVFLGKVTHVIIDEVDTLLTQGFGPEVRAILKGVFSNAERRGSVQLVMATATLTPAVRRLLDEEFDPDMSEAINPSATPTMNPKRSSGEGIPIKVLEVSGLHKSLPNMRHDMLDTKGVDKIEFLLETLTSHARQPTLVFCNTVNSCRAVEYALKEAEIPAKSYHGELNSKEREANLQLFRESKVPYLVCTDIAARGLDIPTVGHVVMFDFPHNPIDYIHRAGRTARAGNKGLVTSILQKRDLTLANAIEAAIKQQEPLDTLTNNRRDYMAGGKLRVIRPIGQGPASSPTGNKHRKVLREQARTSALSNGRPFARTPGSGGSSRGPSGSGPSTSATRPFVRSGSAGRPFRTALSSRPWQRAEAAPTSSGSTGRPFRTALSSPGTSSGSRPWQRDEAASPRRGSVGRPFRTSSSAPGTSSGSRPWQRDAAAPSRTYGSRTGVGAARTGRSNSYNSGTGKR